MKGFPLQASEFGFECRGLGIRTYARWYVSLSSTSVMRQSEGLGFAGFRNLALVQANTLTQLHVGRKVKPKCASSEKVH